MLARWLTRLGIAFGVFVAVLVVAAIVVYAMSEQRINKKYAITPRPLVLPTDSASLARGAHLTQAIGMCVECHGEKLDGQLMFDGPLGTVAARNLTRGMGGVGSLLTDADYVRAIRHGLAPDGRPLMMMPAQDFLHFSDADLAAVIAYVKSVPPADNVPPESKIAPLGRALLVIGTLPLLPAERINHNAPSRAPVQPGGTREYGAYITRIACKGCHGPALAGGPIEAGDPSWPPASNLTVSGPTKSWSEADFVKLMRTGRRPDSMPVNSAMPWKNAGRMTDEELHAVWTYLRSLPGRTNGGPNPSTSMDATLGAATQARMVGAHLTWFIAQVQKIASSGDIPPDESLESE
jgi:mono/diheme cytochrome c family protein